MRMLLTGASLDFAASVSLSCLPLTYTCTGVCAYRHFQHQHACRRPIRQCLAPFASLLPTDWRTEVAREGLGREELRGKTAGHMSRDLFTNPRQSRAEQSKGRKGKGELQAGRREACHDKASWRCERLNATHADTHPPLSLDFFSQLK